MPELAPEGAGKIARPEDRRWMERAFALAQQSIGLASPNPAVGCVLVRDGLVTGEGFHQYDALDHAEIVALKQAGSRARGATAYVTLEPCSHHGRTGPCSEALLRAGVRRVVFAIEDPNPLVHGRGAEQLRAAGVEVQSGLLADQARKLNETFARFTRAGLPFVTVKIASSLDGRIAPQGKEPGSTSWITGEEARAEVHRMRHAADALLTGVGTLLADDPLLSDRSGLPRRRPLLRVVLDSALRTPPDSRLVSSSNGDLIIFCASRAAAAKRRALEARGIRVEQLPSGATGEVVLAPVFEHLAKSKITSVLVEGGSRINAAMLKGGFADKLVIFFAPTLLGANAAPAFAEGAPFDPVQNFTLKRFGRDFAFEAYLRDPWAGLN